MLAAGYKWYNRMYCNIVWKNHVNCHRDACIWNSTLTLARTVGLRRAVKPFTASSMRIMGIAQVLKCATEIYFVFTIGNHTGRIYWNGFFSIFRRRPCCNLPVPAHQVSPSNLFWNSVSLAEKGGGKKQNEKLVHPSYLGYRLYQVMSLSWYLTPFSRSV